MRQRAARPAVHVAGDLRRSWAMRSYLYIAENKTSGTWGNENTENWRKPLELPAQKPRGPFLRNRNPMELVCFRNFSVILLKIDPGRREESLMQGSLATQRTDRQVIIEAS